MKKLPYYYIFSFALYLFTIFCLQFFNEVVEDWEYIFWGIFYLLAPFIQVWDNEFWKSYNSTKDRRPSIWRKLDDRFIEWSTKTKEQETDSKLIIENNQDDDELNIPDEDSEEIGTGFLISKNGFIATANHVISNAKRIKVRFPLLDTEYNGKLIDADEDNDLAIIKIPKTGLNKKLKNPIPFLIDKDLKVSIGQNVYNFGYPFGEMLGSQASFSEGKISSLEGLLGDSSIYRVSNPINPGNSGGPLVDNFGRLIGIIVSSLDDRFSLENQGVIPQNVNFSVKVDILLSMTDKIDKINLCDFDSNSPELSPTKLSEKVLPFVPQIIINTN